MATISDTTQLIINYDYPNELLMNVTMDELKSQVLNKIIVDFANRDHIFDGLTETVLKIAYTLLILTGIVANVLVIGIIVANKKLMTSNNLLLLNLFVSDILLCIFCMPFTLLAITRRSYPFGPWICKLVPFIQAVTTLVSAATVLSIAIDRMIQIKSNQSTAVRPGMSIQSTPKLIKYAINTLIIWLLSTIISSPICIYQSLVEYGIPGVVIFDKCVEHWPYHIRGVYSLVILITQLLIPSTVMLVSHYRIRSHLSDHRVSRCYRSVNRYYCGNSLSPPKPDDEEAVSSLSTTQLNTNSGNNNNNNTKNIGNNNYENNNNNNIVRTNRLDSSHELTVGNDRETSIVKGSPSFVGLNQNNNNKCINKEMHRNNRVTIFLVTLTAIFSVSWLPLNVFNIYVDFNPDVGLSTRDLFLVLAVCHLIAMSSATTNAILYGFLHTAIRNELTDTINKIKCYFRR
ncbi:neuropeptide Y receptor type 2-like [Oppia nitens]|uniref:neuropeptide Y receptor type 2-like n=1 Tax=Oppia nitens TaxID=1686743 RepID=UPI0023DBC9B2|nr:neuropeptide Y receptor type 2-like [Oppia nitens]